VSVLFNFIEKPTPIPFIYMTWQ